MYPLYLPFPFIPSLLAYTNHFIYRHLVMLTLTHVVTHQEINISSSIFYVEIYHSYKRRKLSADTLQEIIDDRAIDLEDFDIDDSNRTLPPHIFDIDGTYINRYSDTFHSQAWLEISCDIY